MVNRTEGAPMIHQLCVIGVGLIGGSLARALREADKVERVVGCGRGEDNLKRAVELGVIDEYVFDPAAAAEQADMIVVATTLGATAAVFEQIAPVIADDAVVTDVGSVKGQVVAAARRCFGSRFPRFVPGHPIAGTEKSGVEASFASLFQDHRVILTPVAETDADACDRVAEMWLQTGARVSRMAVERHDEVLAATSHLPHMLAYALVGCLAGMDGADDIFDFAAGGFRDFTRIASSSPAMWCDIALQNREALLTVLNSFTATYEQLCQALEEKDGETLLALFERAKHTRDSAVLPQVK